MGTGLSWAQHEIELAKNEESPDIEEYEREYNCACYDSALAAYETLTKAGHSGCSMGITVNILKRLCDNLPLLPITEKDFDGVVDISDSPEYLQQHNMRSEVQCPRRSSLFRTEYLDGRVEYTDVDRWLSVNINNPSICYYFGLVGKLLDKMYPITFPYMPVESQKVYCEDFSTDTRNGDFDTIGIFYLINSKGEKVEINKFYKGDVNDPNWIEITKEEYDKRKANKLGEIE